MYVRKSFEPRPDRFPSNYNGNLNKQTFTDCEYNTEKRREHVTYKIKKNMSLCDKRKSTENFLFGNFKNDELILLGLIVFLYVGCEHTKDNIVLMAILAYLLIGCQDA